jgi:hypothetical protein
MLMPTIVLHDLIVGGATADEAEMKSLRQRYRAGAGPAVAQMTELLARSPSCPLALE